MVPLSEATLSLPDHKGSKATGSLVFAASVSALGFNTFFVKEAASGEGNSAFTGFLRVWCKMMFYVSKQLAQLSLLHIAWRNETESEIWQVFPLGKVWCDTVEEFNIDSEAEKLSVMSL